MKQIHPALFRARYRHGRKWSQRDDEAMALVKLLQQERVRSYLEIGLRLGHTFQYVGHHLPRQSRMIGVDLPGSVWGIKKGGSQAIEAVIAELQQYGQFAEVRWGDSTAPDIVTEVRALGPYDFVLIDGDHRLPGVRADWENYGSMAKMVAFHDIDVSASRTVKPERRAQYGVPLLWVEIKDNFRHVEIIGKNRGMGLGVLWRTA